MLRDFAARHGVRRLALFGSVLRDDFGPASDVDLLVEFHPERTPGLLHLAQMELELEDALGRNVELRTIENLSRHFRDKVVLTHSRCMRAVCSVRTRSVSATSRRRRPRRSPTSLASSGPIWTMTSSSGSP
jgi:uncharacterized protein